MKTTSRMIAVLGLVAFLSPGVQAQPADWSADLNRILSRLQSMGHGYYTEQEWQDVFRQMDEVSARAAQAKAWETLVELSAIKAMVYSDMMGAHAQALEVLRGARQQYAPLKPRNMARLYVREADVLSKMGNEAGISRLIEEFRTSGFYDPERYAYAGGWGPKDPLAVVRPMARGDDSISVSAMETSRLRARFAPGRAFPDFAGRDHQGRPVRLSDYRGKVVLVDFWIRGSLPWKRELPELKRLYEEYGPQGFQIIGVSLERDPSGLSDFLREQGIAWPQVVGNRDLPKQLGIFGDVTNFLLDRNGVIVARNVKGGNLTAAVRRTLALP